MSKCNWIEDPRDVEEYRVRGLSDPGGNLPLHMVCKTCGQEARLGMNFKFGEPQIVCKQNMVS